MPTSSERTRFAGYIRPEYKKAQASINDAILEKQLWDSFNYRNVASNVGVLYLRLLALGAVG